MGTIFKTNATHDKLIVITKNIDIISLKTELEKYFNNKESLSPHISFIVR